MTIARICCSSLAGHQSLFSDRSKTSAEERRPVGRLLHLALDRRRTIVQKPYWPRGTLSTGGLRKPKRAPGAAGPPRGKHSQGPGNKPNLPVPDRRPPPGQGRPLQLRSANAASTIVSSTFRSGLVLPTTISPIPVAISWAALALGSTCPRTSPRRLAL